MNRLQEIETRRLEIRSLLEGDENADLEAIDVELRSLDDEKQQLEKRAAIAAGINAGTVSAQKIEIKEERKMEFTKENVLGAPEYRSAYLKRLQGKALNEVEERALTTASNSAGAAVPTQTFDRIIDKLRQTSVLFTRVSVSYVPGNLSFVVANAKNAAAWKNEGADGTPADDTVTSVQLTGYELIKLVQVSAAASAMTIDAFEAYIIDEIGRQIAIAIENAIITGDGTGKPTGILQGVTWSSSNSTTWAANASVGYDNLVDGLALLPTAYLNNAAFVMNRKMLFSGIRKIKATDGNPIFAYNAQDRTAMTVLGYPVILDDYVPDDTIVLGDMSYYRLNFAQSPTIETSREAAFISGKVTYRGLAVADGKPVLGEAFVKISKALA